MNRRIFRQQQLKERLRRKEIREKTKQAQGGYCAESATTQTKYPDCPKGYVPMLSLILNTVGVEKLRNAEILEFGPGKEHFYDFLSRQFDAKTEAANVRVQAMNRHFRGRKFKLIIANKVFERDAFMHENFRRDIELEQPIEIYPEEGGLRRKRAWLREERTNLLKKLVSHLKPGGKIIITAVSSKTIFHPDEISRAGLRIQMLNFPTQHILATVLTKPPKMQ